MGDSVAASERGVPAPIRRLLILVGAIVLVDTMFYAALAPLLPQYEEHLGLSKAAVGILAAAYPAGVIVGALPAGWLTARLGVRPVVLIGLALMSVASVAFGFAEHFGLLVGARFVQGAGGSFSWSGGLAWLVDAAPRARRGELLGAALASALGGALLGPALGSLATITSSGLVFSAVAVLGAGLAVLSLKTPAPRPTSSSLAKGLAAGAREGRVLAGLWIVMVVGLFFGVIEVLVPLRLDALGVGVLVIGGVFLAMAGLEALANPVFGRWSDQRGRLSPIRFGLLASVLFGILLPLPDIAWLLAAIVMLSGPGVGSLWTPTTALLSDGAEAVGLDQGFAFALMNLAWAVAQFIGGAGGGGLAQATDDAVSYATLALICAITLALSWRTGGEWQSPVQARTLGVPGARRRRVQHAGTSPPE